MKMTHWISILLLIFNVMWCSNASEQPIIYEISIVTRSLSSVEMSTENSKSGFGFFTPPNTKHWGIIVDIYNKVYNEHHEKMVELTILKEKNNVKIRFYDWNGGEEDKWNEKNGEFQKTKVWSVLSNPINSHEEIVYDQDWIDNYVDNFNRKNPNYQGTRDNCQKFVTEFLKDVTGESEKSIQMKIIQDGIPVRTNFGHVIMLILMVVSLDRMDVPYYCLELFAYSQLLVIFLSVIDFDEKAEEAGLITLLFSTLLVYIYIVVYTLYCILMDIINQSETKESRTANIKKMICILYFSAATYYFVVPYTYNFDVINELYN